MWNRTTSFTTGMTAKEPIRAAQGTGQQGDFRGRAGSYTQSSTSQIGGRNMGIAATGQMPKRECSYCLLPSHTWVTCKLNSAGPNYDASWKPPYRMKGKPFPPPQSIEQSKKIEATAAHVQQDASIDEITVQDESMQEEVVARMTHQTQSLQEDRTRTPSPDFEHQFNHCRINTCQTSPTIQARIGTVLLTALIDTGSPRSVISTETWRHIKDKALFEGRRSNVGNTKERSVSTCKGTPCPFSSARCWTSRWAARNFPSPFWWCTGINWRHQSCWVRMHWANCTLLCRLGKRGRNFLFTLGAF